MIGDNESQDKRASFFGKINDQVDKVCKDLKLVKGLQNGFNGVGFSQGGLMMRAYLQRCNDPPILNLVTFGSPHAGLQFNRGCKY